jgi:hypothetical protein
MTTVLIISALVLIAIWNGKVIMWHLTGLDKYSKVWHSIGLIIRLVLCAVLYLSGGVIWAVVGCVIASIGYNIIINMIMGQKWYYVGKTSVIDKLIRRLFYKD